MTGIILRISCYYTNTLLTNTLVSKLRKAFANSPSVNIKFSITQLNKIGRSDNF